MKKIECMHITYIAVTETKNALQM